MNEITPFGAATPAIIVGHSPDGRLPPLGLGEPFALLGGDRLGPAGIAFDILHDHQPHFVDWVAQGCRDQLAAGNLWFRASPMILTGPAGAGRTHAGRCLAATAGLPHIVLNLTDPLIASGIAASRGVQENLWASPMTIAMAATRCANPVVSVIGADRAGADVALGLKTLIDPDAGQSLIEDQLGIAVDLSQVTWILQCDEPGTARSIIGRRGLVVSLLRTPIDLDTVFTLSIFREAMQDCGAEMNDPNLGWDRVKAALPYHYSPHASDLYAAMVNAITTLRFGVAPSFTDDVPF